MGEPQDPNRQGQQQLNIELSEEIAEGDLIASVVGVAHQITNTSDEDLRYLVISSQATSDIVHYPDSNKFLAYSSAFAPPLVHISHADSHVDYYEGEE